MARVNQSKNDNVEVKNVTQYKGIAKKFIKYDGKFLNVGEKFDIEEKDIEELKQYADIEEIKVEITPNNDANDENKDGDGKKEGE